MIMGLSAVEIGAAQDIADGSLTMLAIAEKHGVTRQTLHNWRRNPEFIAEVDRFQAEFAEEVRRRGLAILERRVHSLNDRWRRLQEVMAARAADPSMQGVPGAETGLLVRTYKQLGSGESARVVEEYEIDAALLREFREHEKQAAQELGQWIEKKDHTSEGKRMPITRVEVVCPTGSTEDDPEST